MASNRHLGRIVALQTLYEHEFRKEVGDSDVDYNTVRDIIIDQLSILPELPAFNSVNEIKNTINTILE